MNGDPQFELGKELASLHAKIDACLEGIKEIKSVRDDFIVMRSEFGTLKKVMWGVFAPIFAGFGSLLWAYFQK